MRKLQYSLQSDSFALESCPFLLLFSLLFSGAIVSLPEDKVEAYTHTENADFRKPHPITLPRTSLTQHREAERGWPMAGLCRDTGVINKAASFGILQMTLVYSKQRYRNQHSSNFHLISDSNHWV